MYKSATMFSIFLNAFAPLVPRPFIGQGVQPRVTQHGHDKSRGVIEIFPGPMKLPVQGRSQQKDVVHRLGMSISVPGYHDERSHFSEF
jgi:hypothetical protein